jgi:hypothetical protein
MVYRPLPQVVLTVFSTRPLPQAVLTVFSTRPLPQAVLTVVRKFHLSVRFRLILATPVAVIGAGGSGRTTDPRARITLKSPP